MVLPECTPCMRTGQRERVHPGAGRLWQKARVVVISPKSTHSMTAKGAHTYFENVRPSW